mmetsp:Transcript_20004/g.42092  ORF Transcript_20004/g.42092 Transcript_20004/m.42092 type:complete len:216 (+) Transcript_20004:84-731(+)
MHLDSLLLVHHPRKHIHLGHARKPKIVRHLCLICPIVGCRANFQSQEFAFGQCLPCRGVEQDGRDGFFIHQRVGIERFGDARNTTVDTAEESYVGYSGNGNHQRIRTGCRPFRHGGGTRLMNQNPLREEISLFGLDGRLVRGCDRSILEQTLIRIKFELGILRQCNKSLCIGDVGISSGWFERLQSTLLDRGQIGRFGCQCEECESFLFGKSQYW